MISSELKYNMKIYPLLVGDKVEWGAEYPSLNIVGGGNTIEEAIEELEDNAKALFEYFEEENIAIPEPEYLDTNAFNGKIALRTSKTNHKRLKDIASEQGISLNSVLNDCVSNYLGQHSMLQDLKNEFKTQLFVEIKK